MRVGLILLVVAASARADTGRGDDLFAAHDYRAAAVAYRAAIAEHPDDVEARYRLGVARAAAGELVEAADAWQAVLALAPADGRARRNLELLRLRRDVGALDDPVLLEPYVRALVAQGRLASARAALDRVDVTGRAPLLELRAEIELALGDAPAAVDDYGRLLLLLGRSARPLRGLAAAWRAAGFPERAAYYERLSRAASDTR
jgi:tetratricopeptide (TPR) repeat protein